MNKKSFSTTLTQQRQQKKDGPSLLLKRKSQIKKGEGNELKICVTDLVNKFKANNRLVLSNDTQEKIKKTLQIHGAAETGYNERENFGRFYLTYNNNPFTQEFYKKTLNYDELQKLSKTEKIDVLEAQRKKKRAVQLGNDLKKKFIRLDQTMTQLSRRILSHRMQINHDTNSQTLIGDPLRIIPPIIQMTIKNGNYIEQLQRIVNLRQKKAIINGEQDIDIFKFLFNPKAECFKTMLQRLLKYNFQTESVIYQLIKQTKINPFDHISTYSRNSIVTRKKKTLAQLQGEKAELATKIDDINFQQIMFLVAGKVRSDELLVYLTTNFQQNNQFQQAKVYLESREGFNVYQQNQRHQKTYIDNTFESIERQSVHLPYKIEYKEKMQKIRKIYEFCTQFNIQDQALNDYLNFRKERLVCGLFDKDPHKFKNIDSKVLLSKRFKDGFEQNRSRAVTQILTECKKFIKPKSKKNNENKSKSKTQQITIKKITQNNNFEKTIQKNQHQTIKIQPIQDFTSRKSLRARSSSKSPSSKYTPNHKFQFTDIYGLKKTSDSHSKTLSLMKNLKHRLFEQKEQKHSNQYNLLINKPF